MFLSQDIQKDILETFSTLKNFNSTIDEVCNNLNNEDRYIVQGIKLYYNNCFDMSVNVESDTIFYMDIALHCITRLKELYKETGLFIFKFMFRRIEKNILWVENAKKLA